MSVREWLLKRSLIAKAGGRKLNKLFATGVAVLVVGAAITATAASASASPVPTANATAVQQSNLSVTLTVTGSGYLPNGGYQLRLTDLPRVFKTGYVGCVADAQGDMNCSINTGAPYTGKTIRYEWDDLSGNFLYGPFTATVTPYVAPPTNHNPVAKGDSATTNENTAVTVNVLANDSDQDGNSLTVASVTNPNHGSAKVVNNEVLYTPADGYNGSDSFKYTVSDGHGGSATATVSVTVKQVITPPPVKHNPKVATETQCVPQAGGSVTFDVTNENTYVVGTYTGVLKTRDGKPLGTKTVSNVAAGATVKFTFSGVSPEEVIFQVTGSDGTSAKTCPKIPECQTQPTVISVSPGHVTPECATKYLKPGWEKVYLTGNTSDVTATGTVNGKAASLPLLVPPYQNGVPTPWSITATVKDASKHTFAKGKASETFNGVNKFDSSKCKKQTTPPTTQPPSTTPPATHGNTTPAGHSSSPNGQAHAGTVTATVTPPAQTVTNTTTAPAPAPSSSIFTPGFGGTGDGLADTGSSTNVWLEVGIGLLVIGLLMLLADFRRRNGARQH